MENILVSLFKGYADTCPIEVPLKTIISLLRDNQAVIEHTESIAIIWSKNKSPPLHAKKHPAPALPSACASKAENRKQTSAGGQESVR